MSECLVDFGRTEPMEDDTERVAPFVELLIGIRGQLRAAAQWELADEIRQGLFEIGIILEDGPTKTAWRKAAAGGDGT